ncbi:hypothetical protein BDR07DRAFT_1480813 [Suillus spraguei]|nr:hypothetical protein BDR07DRAFT_1480813 [Suillus spraguei]
MIHISPDWALATTHIASEYVTRQFLALIGGQPNAIHPLKLDFVMLMACSKLASTLTDAYQNPVTINLDVARYANVLHMMEKSINPAREDSLLAQCNEHIGAGLETLPFSTRLMSIGISTSPKAILPLLALPVAFHTYRTPY